MAEKTPKIRTAEEAFLLAIKGTRNEEEMKKFRRFVRATHPRVLLDMVEEVKNHPHKALHIGRSALQAMPTYLWPSKKKAKKQLKETLLDIAGRQVLQLTRVLDGIEKIKPVIMRLEPMREQTVKNVNALLEQDVVRRWFTRNSLAFLSEHGTQRHLVLLRKIAEHEHTPDYIKGSAQEAARKLDEKLSPIQIETARSKPAVKGRGKPSGRPQRRR